MLKKKQNYEYLKYIPHHNYYNKNEFYYYDEEGILINVYGQRVLRVSEDFIVGIQAGLEEEVGDAAGEIMYRCGYLWGVEDSKNFSERFKKEFKMDFHKARSGFLMETWWWPLTMGGWGTWKYDFSQQEQGLIFIDLYESAVAKSLGLVGEVVCHFYAGLLAAMFSLFTKHPLGAIEVQCYATGANYCKFLIAGKEQINTASFWRSEGLKSEEIFNKLAK